MGLDMCVLAVDLEDAAEGDQPNPKSYTISCLCLPVIDVAMQVPVLAKGR